MLNALAPVTAWASVVVPLLALIVPMPTNLPAVVNEPVPRSKLTVSFESPLTLPVMLPPVMFSVSVPLPNRIWPTMVPALLIVRLAVLIDASIALPEPSAAPPRISPVEVL
jgi:hypothetical protein